MTHEPHIEKVAAFITRDVRNLGVTTRQLLVFEHTHPPAESRGGAPLKVGGESRAKAPANTDAGLAARV